MSTVDATVLLHDLTRFCNMNSHSQYIFARRIQICYLILLSRYNFKKHGVKEAKNYDFKSFHDVTAPTEKFSSKFD